MLETMPCKSEQLKLKSRYREVKDNNGKQEEEKQTCKLVKELDRIRPAPSPSTLDIHQVYTWNLKMRVTLMMGESNKHEMYIAYLYSW